MLQPFIDFWHQLGAIPHIKLYASVLWLGYMLWLSAVILLQKREPAATLSWLLGLAALPYIGFIVWYVFGPQKINRYRLRRVRAREGLPIDTALPNQDAREMARLAKATGGLPPSSAVDVQLLVDGAAKFDALIADLAAAREHVHVEYYIYMPDETGTRLRDALADCARRGVQVRVLLDAVGAKKVTASWFAPVLDAGGELRWFHPMRFDRALKLWKRPWLNMRTHRKIVVIDGVIGYTGGINITDEENERLRNDAYRDLHLRIVGSVVRSLQVIFAEDWVYAGGERSIFHLLPALDTPPLEGPIPAQALASGPDSSWESIHRVHVSAIHVAKQRVWLVTPYFVPGEAAMMALTSAAFGGLDVRVLVPQMSDSRLVTYAARSYYGKLLQAGVRVFEYGPRMLHSKALLTDDSTAIIGTANFDSRSFRLNFEVSMLFQDSGVAGRLEQVIATDMAHATEITLQLQRSLWRARLPEAFARLLSPVL